MDTLFVLAFFAVEVNDDHGYATRHQLACAGQAQTRCATGDDSGHVGEFHFSFLMANVQNS